MTEKTPSPGLHLQGFSAYFLGSCIALAADTALLMAGVHYGASLFWAATAGFLVGSLLSYAVSSRVAFSLKHDRPDSTSFIAFTCLGLLGLGFTQLVLHTLTALACPLLPAKAVAAAGSFFATFLLRKRLLFTHKIATA